MSDDREISVYEQEQLLLLLAFHLVYWQVHAVRTDESRRIRLIVGLLRQCYAAHEYPYGDDEHGFHRWLLDRWPSPPSA